MRILLLGRDGQLGWELARLLPAIGTLSAMGRSELDLAKPADVRRAVREVGPRVIVNAAAYTDVDAAESQPALAQAVNADAPGLLAEETRRLGGLLVHFSTDYVYDGTKAGAYVESDPPNPLSVYGRSKLAGDRAVEGSGAAHLIFRASWLYGARGRNFLLTLQRLLRERDEVEVVADRIGAPTWCRSLAQAVVTVLGAAASDEAALERLAQHSGVYHCSAAGATSWYGFAQAIHALRGPLGGRPALLPIPSSRYPARAQRPANSVLSNARLGRTFGIAQSHWREQLAACMGEVGG
jgi:dTDP-4-dehydrorhamnose reductase